MSENPILTANGSDEVITNDSRPRVGHSDGLITSPQTPKKGMKHIFQTAQKFGGPKTSWEKHWSSVFRRIFTP